MLVLDQSAIISVSQAAELLELPLLSKYLNNIRNKEQFLNDDITSQIVETTARKLESTVLGRRTFSDIEFVLDDGRVPAHKPLLMARCDMMQVRGRSRGGEMLG